MSVIFCLFLTLFVILLILYIISKWNFDYWEKRKVPHLKPLPLFGNYIDYMTLQKADFEVAQDICRQLPKEPYIGTYFGTKPALLVQDPELIKLITTKDFAYFSSRGVSKYADREILTKNMFFTYGDRWKVIRQNTSPLFTTSKIKNMFPLILQCVRTFEEMLQREMSISNVLEARSLMARYTMDCIGSCGFGVNTDTMGTEIAKNPFRKMGETIFKNSTIAGIFVYFRLIWPGLFYGLGFSRFPKKLTDFFHNLIMNVIKERQYKASTRNDFVDLVLNLKQQEYLKSESILVSKKGEIVSLKVDDELLVAQIVLFFAAGFETTSSTTSYTLYQLAMHQEAQEKARAEVDEYLKRTGGKIEYDCVSQLPFLEACIEEGMRMYPALGLLTREVMDTYELPTGLKLEPGTMVHLPVYHLHNNPEYFPDPEKYRPERFLPENKANIKPYTYMPFGEGQRICLGIRVAKMQMIPGMITIFRKYKFELAEGVPKKLAFQPRTVVTQSIEELRLKFIPRDV